MKRGGLFTVYDFADSGRIVTANHHSKVDARPTSLSKLLSDEFA